MADLRTEFINPPTRYRGAPFWSWNDRLQVKELVRQVHDMKTHGMGGFFMHSREGLETEYLSEEWMTCIRGTVKAAKEAGTYAWLYDEDRWPSGAAGGLVPARGGDAFRAKALTVERVEGKFVPGDDVLAVFRTRLADGKLLEATRVSLPDSGEPLSADEGQVLLLFRREVSGPSEWFNNDAPADNLNPDAVAAFIDITYEAYRRQFGDEFGKTVPGIFTDEPNVSDAHVRSGRPWLPWTDGLAEYFVAHRGYDLLDVIPYVFLDGDRSEKARHDYWWTISERYTEAFSKQIGEWCEAHNLAFTGHFLYENNLGRAIVSGGAVMPHYQYQHVPGIDMLCVQTDENLTVKQCTSVAHQFGREFVLSETYGCSGWEMTFEEQKWVGDWQYVLGVSLRCQHLALYTLRGCRKRDYPPAFNYNTTWWKYNGVVEDYFARVGLLTTQGRAVRDVLVVHPVATAWTMIGHVGHQRSSAGIDAADRFGETVNRFTRAVLAAHYDFDFGDEQLMADFGRVDGETLRLNQAPYKVVIVPPETKTLLRSTVALLERFLEAGGKVIAFEPVLTMIEAAADQRMTDLMRQPGVTVLSDLTELQVALEAAIPRRVSICDQRGQEAGRFLYMQRAAKDKSIFFVVNNDQRSAHRVRLTLEGHGRLEEWDPLTGEIKAIPVQVLDDALRFEADFGAAGSRLYVLDPTLEPVTLRAEPKRRRAISYIGPVCRFQRTDPNVLTLDVCRYRLDDSEWSAPMPVWEAQKAVREALDMRPVYYNRLPQRYKWVNQPHPEDGTPLAFHFEFEVRDVPENSVFLLVEGAEDFQITLNGAAVSNEIVGWYLDRSFDKVALPALQPGVNTLVLACAYQERMEVEDCYLSGDFGVDVNRVIVREPERLHFGDWCLQGYLHYPGSMIYRDTLTYQPADGERIVLTLGNVSAVSVAVHVNGALAGHIPWRSANGLDITPYLREGENELGIEVVGSPRNMLGPLHQKAGYLAWTDWRSFRRQGDDYTPEYVLHPYGLLGQAKIEREE
jgi:hypothetical protein